MPKTKQRKQEDVQKLIALLTESKGVVFANVQGLTVKQLQDLKKQGKLKKVAATMAKKTLLRLAFHGANLPNAQEPKEFQGGIGVFYSSDDEIAPAKLIAEYGKTNKIINFFGGVFEGKFIDAPFVSRLSALPSKQELLSRFVSSLNAPAAGFANVLAANLRALLNVLNGIAGSN